MRCPLISPFWHTHAPWWKILDIFLLLVTLEWTSGIYRVYIWNRARLLLHTSYRNFLRSKLQRVVSFFIQTNSIWHRSNQITLTCLSLLVLMQCVHSRPQIFKDLGFYDHSISKFSNLWICSRLRNWSAFFDSWLANFFVILFFIL